MSGGSWDYLYQQLEEAAGRLGNAKCPLRKALAHKMWSISKAMRAIEWVDSGDYAPGDEIEAIKTALAPATEALVLNELIKEAEETTKNLKKWTQAARKANISS